MITPDTSLTYNVGRLLVIFTATRDHKQAQIDNALKDGMGAWATGWPGGNVRIEQQSIHALQAWKDAGVIEIVTARVLSDVDATSATRSTGQGDVHDSFFMQLTKNEITPVLP